MPKGFQVFLNESRVKEGLKRALVRSIRFTLTKPDCHSLNRKAHFQKKKKKKVKGPTNFDDLKIISIMLIFFLKKKQLPFINLSVQQSFTEHLVLGRQWLFFTMMYKKHNSFP